MSRIVRVELGPRSYPIHIAPGLLLRLGELIPTSLQGRSALLVTDATVAALYADRVAHALTALRCPNGRAIVPAGESSKDGRWLFHVYEKAVEQGLDRKSFVVALGGGVVGDLAGFAAASYLRGIPFVQIPTTLMAMVDSAVGGKTGINLPQGKNLVGAFHQPDAVLCDLDALRTLPRRELVAGLAEVIKYGVIADAALFEMLEGHVEPILGGDADVLARIVARSCEIKAAVVGQDEREETGARATLNFGHTAGHAVEAVSGYGHFLHGEAVAIGMVYAARLSAELCGLPARDVQRIARLCARFGLPTEIPDCPWSPIRRAMGVDKKSTGGCPRFVLASALGQVRHGHEVPEDVLQRTWETRPAAGSHGF